MRRFLFVCSLAIALTWAASAPAHNASFPTKSTIKLTRVGGSDAFTGKVSSALPACMRNRVVKLYDIWGSRHIYYGKDRTDAEGNWLIKENRPPPGPWYVKVVKKVATPAGHRHVCLPGRSRNYKLPGF